MPPFHGERLKVYGELIRMNLCPLELGRAAA